MIKVAYVLSIGTKISDLEQRFPMASPPLCIIYINHYCITIGS